ncbi:MAG TPA: calcium/proton exchanger [Tepidisphaeraceae bacterium]|jgi:Ca2+:H+ antiporter|nr:calcium/proton exchanger [Tepidisphaeraceae bacterium]
MKWVYLLGYLAMPAAFVVHYWLGRETGAGRRAWEPTATFILAGLSIVPLARLMGQATEHLAVRTGPTWGGLLNATFGNAAELIIGIVAVSRGLVGVAKASLAGSILGNLLLVAGAAMLAGGWKRERQMFSKAGAETNGGLLTVAVSAMLLPAIFHFSFLGRADHLVQREQGLSIGTSVVLLIVYGLGLIFTLSANRPVFTPAPQLTDEDPAGLSGVAGKWTVRKSMIVLFLASALVAVFSELLVGSVKQAAESLHWNYVFVGVILVAIIGNAAEHSTAVVLAVRNDMDTAMTIAFQSSLQIALFVTPILVLLSWAFTAGGMHEARRMDMIFTPLEVAGVFLSVVIVVTISRNGESNWFEGVLLLAVYAILGITFFYIPAGDSDGYDDGVAPDVPRRVRDDRLDGRVSFEGLSHAASRERTGTPG